MRTLDRTPPTVTGPRPGPDAPTADWSADLFVSIEAVTVGAAWDDQAATWDDAAVIWDDPATSDHTDATCWVQGLSIEVGRPNVAGVFTAGECAMTLDNASGRWSSYDPFGHLIDFLPGRAVDVWAEVAGDVYWLFAGEIVAWRERGTVVEVEAADVFARLNAYVGAWDPGTFGETPAARLESICDLIGFDGPRRFDVGDVTLHGITTERTPLEEMQHVAASDGGVLFADADGALLYRDRSWSAGRPDQTSVPTVSDNVPDADAVVWDLELLSDDDVLVNTVDLANVAEPALEVHAENADSRTLYGTRTLPANRRADLWAELAEGQTLADYIVAARGDATVRVESLTLYLEDPRQDLWVLGIDRRVGDVLEVLHEQPASGGTRVLDVFVAVHSIAHEITPASWTVALGTTRTVGNRTTERWDVDAYTWDDPNPGNVWGF